MPIHGAWTQLNPTLTNFVPLWCFQSPDGTTVVTAAADETLRFWKILSGGEASKKERAAAKESILNTMSIR